MRATLEAARAQATAQKLLAQAASGQAGAEAVNTTAPSASSPVAGKTAGLWAALSVNHSAFAADEMKDLKIEFTIVNDGTRPIEPGIAGSRIIINGQELGDSAGILGNGPRDARFTALPPGSHLRFALRLSDHFQAPGTYRVSWRGEGFRAPEISFRVLPARAP